MNTIKVYIGLVIIPVDRERLFFPSIVLVFHSLTVLFSIAQSHLFTFRGWFPFFQIRSLSFYSFWSPEYGSVTLFVLPALFDVHPRPRYVSLSLTTTSVLSVDFFSSFYFRCFCSKGCFARCRAPGFPLGSFWFFSLSP